MGPDRIDETMLLQRVREEGDVFAFKALFDLYWKPLYLAAYKRLHDHQEAEDIVQEVLAMIWQRRASLTTNEEGSLGAYLFTALRYRIISFYAEVRTERFQGEVLERLLRLPDDDPAAKLITKELQQLLREELNNMPDTMKRAYQLTRDYNYSIRETATTLNLSEQTVKNLITTSTKRIRSAIERYYANESPQALAILVIAILSQKGW